MTRSEHRDHLTVASVPAGHPYVRLGIADPPRVRVLPDPVVDPAEPGRWWPHPHLEPSSATTLAREADLLHVHFGFEHRTPDELRELTEALAGADLPLVVTVHDLTNPHTIDHAAHLERCAVLVGAARGVVTLTAGAADEIRGRWGVRAEVVPHPPLLDEALLARHRRAPGRPRGRRARVGVFPGTLRAGTRCEDLLPALAAACGSIDAELQVHVPDVTVAGLSDPGHPRHDAWRTLRGLPDGALVSGPRPDDAVLCARVASLDVLVLPHRHGTHSGWLELARDLGVTVLVPLVGHLPEQWLGAGSGTPAAGPVAGGFVWDPAAPDEAGSLREGLAHVLRTAPEVARRPAGARSGAVREAHRELYRRVLGAESAAASPVREVTEP